MLRKNLVELHLIPILSNQATHPPLPNFPLTRESARSVATVEGIAITLPVVQRKVAGSAIAKLEAYGELVNIDCLSVRLLEENNYLLN